MSLRWVLSKSILRVCQHGEFRAHSSEREPLWSVSILMIILTIAPADIRWRSYNIARATVFRIVIITTARVTLLLHDVSEKNGKSDHYYRYTTRRLSLRRKGEKVTKLADSENWSGKRSTEGHAYTQYSTCPIGPTIDTFLSQRKHTALYQNTFSLGNRAK